MKNLTELVQRGDTVYYRLDEYYHFELFDVLKAISVRLQGRSLEVPLYSEKNAVVGTVWVYSDHIIVTHRTTFDRSDTYSISVIDFLTWLARPVRAEDANINYLSFCSRPPDL